MVHLGGAHVGEISLGGIHASPIKGGQLTGLQISRTQWRTEGELRHSFPLQPQLEMPVRPLERMTAGKDRTKSMWVISTLRAQFPLSCIRKDKLACE